jgi:outer membrane receptor protein involved in Fe transport
MQFFKRLTVFISCVLFSANIFAQEGKIKGRVSDSSGLSLPGSTIKIEGSNKSAVTDFNGDFVIENVANGSYKIIISYIGFSSKVLSVKVPQVAKLSVSLQEDQSLLDEVVVTGVFDKRTAMESSVAISVLKSATISKIASNSAADLLSYTPGVYVNSAVGEINNTVFSRGVNANQFAVAGGNGYYYVSLMEDGLPVSNLSSGVTVADYFYRADATLSRLESVRGGSASITGANAPGGIFNYVSKTGQSASNEITVKTGLEGNGKNPYNRFDANFGGKMGDKGWFYNVGGFYRKSDGARNPGYAQNLGGQIKANLVKTFENGFVKVYAKYLNDKNGLPQNLPAQNYDNPELVPGFGPQDTYMLPGVPVTMPLHGPNESFTFDPRNLSHSKDFSIGSELKLNFKNGWSMSNNFKVSTRNVEQSLTIMANATPLNGFFTYALMGMVSPGTFSFKDGRTGEELASVQAVFDPTVQGPPFRYTVLSNNLPANSVMQNGVLFNFTNYSNSKLNEVMDQISFNKKLDKHSITFGSFFASSHILTRPNGTANTVLRPIENRPYPLNISYTNPGGIVSQVTSPEGYAQFSGGNFSFKSYDAKQTQLSGFLADDIQLSPKLNLDLGVRYDRIMVEGSNNIGVKNSIPGGADGNPLTLYDNSYFVEGLDVPYNSTLNTFSYSGGLNYKMNNSNSVYARYSSGRKSPDMQFYFDNYTTVAASLDARAQKINQMEIGYKFKNKTVSGSIIPFLSELSNIPVTSIGQDENGLAYYTPIVYNSIRTFGLEVESNFTLTKNFDIRTSATVQSAKATKWQSWVMGSNGATDDALKNYNGNTAENVPNLMFTIVPNYSFEKGYLNLAWKYMGKRAANMSNAFDLPGFHQLNFGAGYTISKSISVAANINNVLNNFGIMNWSATSENSIIDSFSHESFTPAKRAANPNSKYSVLAVQPRAYFLAVTYKF